MKLLRLFHHASTAPASDGLIQSQREAIIDLLNLCRIADDKLMVEEEESEAVVEASLHWESSVPLVTYVAESLIQAEHVVHDAARRASFIQSAGNRLPDTELKTRAVSLCLDIFYSDGVFVDQERAVFAEIKRAMGWPEAN